MSDRWRLPTPIDDAVRGELERLGADRGTLATARAWAGAVGPTIAANATPARMTRDGTLVVHTSSSVWAHELTQMEALVRERLGEAAPARIRFMVGPQPAQAQPDVPGAATEPVRAGPAEREAGAGLAAPIAARELREAVAQAIAAALARRVTT